MFNFIGMGGTKKAEYRRTIEMLMEMTGQTKEKVMYILYLLSDCQYNCEDLQKMATIIKDDINLK